MLSTQCILVSLLIPALFPVIAAPQETKSPSTDHSNSAGVYADSSEGLRLQLQEILAAAKEQNHLKLESLIKQMQIPDYENWFTTTFGQEKGESWAKPYGRELVENQKDLEDSFMQIARDEGEIYVRRVNDNPGSPGGLEAGMIKGVRGAVEFFYASWKGQNSRQDFIGYFVFLDGKFRWDSTIHVINLLSLPDPSKVAPQEDSSGQTTPDPKSRPGDGSGPFHPGARGITYPSCSFCPDPQYTREAKAMQVEGTVTLQVIIQPNGRATDIQIVKSLRADLDQNAVEAVSRWRFKPAFGPSGDPVAVIVPVEITFRLLH